MWLFLWGAMTFRAAVAAAERGVLATAGGLIPIPPISLLDQQM